MANWLPFGWGDPPQQPLGDVGPAAIARLLSSVRANPVGTETTQALGMPDPGFQPGVMWGGNILSAPHAAMAQNAMGNALGWAAPIRAYHGSPYAFNAFDMSKIGSGEGAQAYGHGLYFAGNEGVARSYRDTLSPNGVEVFRGGQSLGMVPNTNVVNDPKFVQAYNSLIPADVPDWIKSGVLRDIRSSGDVGQSIDLDAARQASIARLTKDRLPAGSDEFHQKAVDAINRAYDSINGDVQFRRPGHMYEVNLNVEPQQLLDWDKPLNQQPASVQQFFGQSMGPTPPPGSLAESLRAARMENTGGVAYQSLAQTQGGRVPVTEALRQVGIPGIQYLDQGSRAAGAGTSNYVMFDPSLIDILRRYAVPGMVSAGATAPFLTPPQQ